jgi:hypothetical protein
LLIDSTLIGEELVAYVTVQPSYATGGAAIMLLPHISSPSSRRIPPVNRVNDKILDIDLNLDFRKVTFPILSKFLTKHTLKYPKNSPPTSFGAL